MTSPGREPRGVRWSVRWYRVVLRLFPKSFRDRFGDQLVSTFGAIVAERQARDGLPGLIRQWRLTLGDVARQAPAERWSSWTGRPLRLSARTVHVSGHDSGASRRSAIEAVGQDLRFARRTLTRTPWSSMALVATIALGIGATTTIFTVVNGVLLRPLPFEASDRVVRLCELSQRTADFCVASAVNVEDLGRVSRQLEVTAVVRNEAFIATTGRAPSPVSGAIATPGFFTIAGLRPALGRVFVDSDLDPGSNDVIIISHAFWRDRLGANPDTIGRPLMVDGRSVRIIGVLPPDAYVPLLPSTEMWKPLTASVDDVTRRGWRGFMALGRLTPDATPDRLDAELSGLYAQLAGAYPTDYEGWTLRAVGLRDHIVGPYRSTLLLFQGAVALVLLIACANVAGLLLVRAATRRGEFAVRTSLGAGRGRLTRQLLTESLAVSIAGAAVGLLLALWATDVFIGMAPSSIPRLAEVSIDGRVALFAMALATLTAVVFGLAPARQAGRISPARVLTSLRATPAGQRRTRSLLVVGEVALAFVLLVGAGLLTRGLLRVVAWDPGFDRTGLVVSWMLSPPSTRDSGEAAVRALEQARDAVSTLPGVAVVGLASAGPLFGGEETDTVQVDDGPARADGDGVVSQWFDVGPHYFSTLGLTARRGRLLAATDTAASPAVAVVNEAFARRVFPDADALGRRVTLAGHSSEIVGIIADTRPTHPDQAAPPEIYWPIRQYRRLAAYLVMRVEQDASNVEASVRERVAEVDPGLQLTSFRTVDEMFDRTLTSPRFNMALLGAFAAVAVGLALVGVYGVIASLVASRRREFGIKLALGASPRRLLVDVIRSGSLLILAGLAFGLIGASLAARLLDNMLFGIPPRDPMTFTIALLVLAVAGLAAVYLPARRASRIDPLATLRAD
jgi:putative ABC transport system permease protein